MALSGQRAMDCTHRGPSPASQVAQGFSWPRAEIPTEVQLVTLMMLSSADELVRHRISGSGVHQMSTNTILMTHPHTGISMLILTAGLVLGSVSALTGHWTELRRGLDTGLVGEIPVSAPHSLPLLVIGLIYPEYQASLWSVSPVRGLALRLGTTNPHLLAITLHPSYTAPN